MRNFLSNTGRLIATLIMTSLLLSSVVARANDNNDFSHLDPQGIVPKRALSQAVAYYKKNRASFTNQNVLTVVDFTKNSNQKRLFIVNLKTGAVEARLTSHGNGSDKNNDGKAEKFSNKDKSYASSVGFYRTLETYSGKHGYSLRLQGLSSTNSNALGRDIVVHKAAYVSESGKRAGRSQGCFAMDSNVYKQVIGKIKGGSLMYAWSGQ